MAPNDFITAKELAELLHCGTKNVYKLADKGSFPENSVAIIGGRRLFNARLIFSAGTQLYNRKRLVRLPAQRKAS